LPAINEPKPISVSKLIPSYLSYTDNKNNARHSIRYNPQNNYYTINSSVIKFNKNTIKVVGQKYNAT